MKIQVRKCGFTGELFEQDVAYLAHLKSLRKRQKQRRNRNHIIQNWKSQLHDLQHSCTHMHELQDWLNCNWPTLLKAAAHMGYDRAQPKDLKLAFKFERMMFSPKVSNTHSCPQSGVTNWGGDPSKPRGYPGWQGTIHISGWQKFNGFVSDYLELMHIHTGTGGSGEYSVRLYASDWPGMLTYQQLTGE